MKGNRWCLKLLATQRVSNYMSSIQSLPDAHACHFFFAKAFSALCAISCYGLILGHKERGQVYISEVVQLLIVSLKRWTMKKQQDWLLQVNWLSVGKLGKNTLARLGRIILIWFVSAETSGEGREVIFTGGSGTHKVNPERNWSPGIITTLVSSCTDTVKSALALTWQFLHRI